MKVKEIKQTKANSDQLLTTRQLARELQVTDRTVQNLVSRGSISKIQVGRCVRFRLNAVMAELEGVAEGRNCVAKTEDKKSEN